MKRQLKGGAVCLGNKDRSPQIAPLVQRALREAGIHVTVDSFGVGASARTDSFRSASENAVTMMQREGIDISKHERRHVEGVNLQSYDFFIVVNDDVETALLERDVDPGRVFVMCASAGGLKDPHDQPIEAFETCVNSIKGELPAIVGFVRALGG